MQVRWNASGVYTEPDHVEAARFLAGLETGSSPNDWTRSLLQLRQAIMLFCPVTNEAERKAGEKTPTMGFALVFPKNGIKAVVRWSVAVGGDEITIPVAAAAAAVAPSRQ